MLTHDAQACCLPDLTVDGNVLPCCAVFITANISGGHLNPAVTLATMFTGHISIPRGLTYIFCQICGAAFGILIVVMLYSNL